MGWFSKTVPERNWVEVSAILASKLKDERQSWYSIFQRETAPHGFALSPEGLCGAASHDVTLLQLQAVAGTLQENGYVSDTTFFLELVFTLLTGKAPAEFHRDIAATPFCLAGDAGASLALWAQAMANELSSGKDTPKLTEELVGYGAFLVARSKFATCIACGDKKEAEKIRRFFIGE
jgi:hypothetical protein